MYCCDAANSYPICSLSLSLKGGHGSNLSRSLGPMLDRPLASAMAGIPDTLKGRSYTRVSDWSRDELELALDLADELKQERLRRKELRVLPGRTIGMIFHKPSTRTRVGVRGRDRRARRHGALPPGRRAPARARRELPRHGARALALRQRPPDPHVRPGRGRHVRRARVDPRDQRAHGPRAPAPGARGRDDDPRAVRRPRGRSARLPRRRQQRLPFADADRRRGSGCTSSPPARPATSRPPTVVAAAAADAAASGGSVALTTDPLEGADAADVLYTDVWTSMGQEEEREPAAARPRALQPRRRAAVGREPRGRRDALPARPRRRGDQRGRALRAAVARLGAGREPPAHPEGADGARDPR